MKRKEAELQSLAAATKAMVQQRAIDSSSWTSALARSDQKRRDLKELRGVKRKKRKKRKKRVPRASRPRLVSGCYLTEYSFSVFYALLGFTVDTSFYLGPGGSLGRIPHFFNVNVALARSALGNLDFLRTPAYLARFCSVPVAPEEYRKIRISGSRLTYFYELFVFGSHLFGVRLWSTGLWTFLGDDFWMFSVSSSCWFNTGYMLRQFTEAFWVPTAENCGVSAAAVLCGRRYFLSMCRG